LLLVLTACRKAPTATVSWAFLDFPYDYDLTSVTSDTCGRWHIVGGFGWHKGIYFTIDGNQVSTPDSLTPKRLNRITTAPGGKLVAVGYTGYYLQKPANAAWQTGHIFDNLNILRDVALDSHHTGIAVAGVAFHIGYAFTIHDNGQTIRADTFEQELRACAFLPGERAVASGYGIIIQRDSAMQWHRLPYYGDFFLDMAFPAPDTGYIIGHAGSLLKTTDGGHHWQMLQHHTTTGRNGWRAVYFTDTSTGFIAGDDGLLLKTTDGGHSWIRAGGLPALPFYDVHVCDTTGLLIGAGGTIIQFDPDF